MYLSWNEWGVGVRAGVAEGTWGSLRPVLELAWSRLLESRSGPSFQPPERTERRWSAANTDMNVVKVAHELMLNLSGSHPHVKLCLIYLRIPLQRKQLSYLFFIIFLFFVIRFLRNVIIFLYCLFLCSYLLNYILF